MEDKVKGKKRTNDEISIGAMSQVSMDEAIDGSGSKKVKFSGAFKLQFCPPPECSELSKPLKKKLNVWRATPAGKQLFESQRDAWKAQNGKGGDAGGGKTKGKNKYVTVADLKSVVQSAFAAQAKAKEDDEEMKPTLSAALAEAAGKPASDSSKFSTAAEALHAKLNAIKGKVSKKGGDWLGPLDGVVVGSIEGRKGTKGDFNSV